MAKSRSGAGPLTLRLPSSASRKPMPRRLRGRALQLRLQARESLDALLHRGGGGGEGEGGGGVGGQGGGGGGGEPGAGGGVGAAGGGGGGQGERGGGGE